MSMSGKYNRFEQIIDWFSDGKAMGVSFFDKGTTKPKNSGSRPGDKKKKTNNDSGSQTAMVVRIFNRDVQKPGCCTAPQAFRRLETWHTWIA